MTNISFDLSGKINPSYIEALHALKEVANSLNIPFIVVGATARDFILEHYHNLKSPRKTTDIDLGTKVADWDQFEQLSNALLTTGNFSKDPSENQRFRFGDVIIDIVPFGPIAGVSNKISWPPEHEIFINLLGFKEAYEHSIAVRLSTNPDLEVRLPTLSGLAIMKIISWKDNPARRQKDAEDILFIMQKYADAGNEDRLYSEEISLLETEGFDISLAGMKLLGKDMAKISETQAMDMIKEILVMETSERSSFRLIADMIRGTPLSGYRFDEILNQLEKLKEGFLEGTRIKS